MQSCRVFSVVILCISTVEHLDVDCFLAVLLYKGEGGRDCLIRNCYTTSQGIPILISSQALSMCMWKEFISIASRNAVKPMLKMYKLENMFWKSTSCKDRPSQTELPSCPLVMAFRISYQSIKEIVPHKCREYQAICLQICSLMRLLLRRLQGRSFFLIGLRLYLKAADYTTPKHP